MKLYYEHAGITIFHGDCAEMYGRWNIDLILTDPMYGNCTNIKGVSSGRGVGRRSKGCDIQARDWALTARDDQPFDPAPWLSYPEVIFWGANHYGSRLPDSSCWIVWDKRDGVASDDNADCEMAWTNLRGPARLIRHLWRGVMRAGEENIAVSGAKLHPFQKPVAVMRFCLSLSKTRGTVLDPFMGSGTTLVAAKQIGRSAVGIDIEEWCCEAAAKRLQQESLFRGNPVGGSVPDPPPGEHG